MIDVEKEFDDFFDFETEDKSIVTSESCKLFAKHCLEMANLREQADSANMMQLLQRTLNYANNVVKAEGVDFDDDGDIQAIRDYLNQHLGVQKNGAS